VFVLRYLDVFTRCVKYSADFISPCGQRNVVGCLLDRTTNGVECSSSRTASCGFPSIHPSKADRRQQHTCTTCSQQVKHTHSRELGRQSTSCTRSIVFAIVSNSYISPRGPHAWLRHMSGCERVLEEPTTTSSLSELINSMIFSWMPWSLSLVAIHLTCRCCSRSRYHLRVVLSDESCLA
jgi:hypothetical protein